MTPKEIRKIETMLDKYNISAILHIPGEGAMCKFLSHGAKLEILELAQIENEANKKIIELEIEDKIESKISKRVDPKLNIPNYIK